MTLGVPLSMIIERHFSLSIKLTTYIVYMIAWCLVPAVLLTLGACRGWDVRPRCAPRAPLTTLAKGITNLTAAIERDGVSSLIERLPVSALAFDSASHSFTPARP